MDQREISALKKQRASNKGRLTQIITWLDNANELTHVEEFRTRLLRVEKLMAEFTAIEAKLFNVDAEQESDFQYEESYYKAFTGLSMWIRSKSASSSNFDTSMNATQSGSGHTEVRLPKLNIPVFSGDYTEWQSFYDLYCSTIHESISLNPVQKFQYLKGLLRGEPAVLLKHITVTEANYLGALNKLKDRYHRRRPIINSFIRTFIDQPAVHTANANNIKRIMDTSDEVVRGLKALGDSAEARDPWLIFILLGKLDDKSKAQWAETTVDLDTPAFSDFLKFLARRIDTLESISNPSTRSKSSVTGHVAAMDSKFTCAMCNEDHSIFHCTQFNEMDVTKRKEWVKTNQRCINCLSQKHLVFKCTSYRRCQQCKQKHHSLLHIKDDEESTDSINPEPTTSQITSNCSQSTSSTTILPTAIIKIVDSSGQVSSCRALLDSGSQVSFMTEACSQKLNLRKKNARLTICGVGQSKAGFTKGAVKFIVKLDNKPEFVIEALVLSKITSKLPHHDIDLTNKTSFRGIELADPNFNKSSNIDVLIGADYFFKILEDGQIKVNSNDLILQKTIFGWVASGKTCCLDQLDIASMIVSTNDLTILDIDRTLRRFWEIESIMVNKNILTPEEQLCEDKFNTTSMLNNNGRFMVRLPFKRSPDCIGVSMNTAIQRQQSMERRFARDPEFYKLYKEFMNDYEKLNHMEEIPQEKINNSGFYLPHHGVLRHSSVTTKLRVVFDGSAKSSSGVSLNDCLAVGPTIQSTLYSILLRFREHKFVFSADVEKMYRQVRIPSDDANFQKIVWRENPSDPIRHYKLLTITYGLASAPFLATRTLKHIAETAQPSNPLAASAIEHDVYVDDLMTGANSENELLQLKNDIRHLLENHGFILRKWSSNSTVLLDTINDIDKITSRKEINISTDKAEESVKLLGVSWTPSADEFKFSCVPYSIPLSLTKRRILSEAGKFFDPLGWIAPINITVKVFIQQLWMLNLGWDDPLPNREANQWTEIRDKLPAIEDISLPRFVRTTKSTKVQLHGFCDASQTAYAAVIYYRVIDEDGTTQINLMTAKTKVAPIKQQTVPRLELCGALLLSNLMELVQKESSLHIEEVFMWTDSMIVLDWLSSHPRRWPTFIANRTSQILSSFSREHWGHVTSSDNPADIASRGMLPHELKSSSMWWHGPNWLHSSNEFWPHQSRVPVTVDNHNVSHTVDVQCDVFENLINKTSSFNKLQRIVAYTLRFITNVRKLGTDNRSKLFLTGQEMCEALFKLCQHDQHKYFMQEIDDLQQIKPIKISSSLKSLNPFIDQFGILRVGGRLEKCDIPFSTKHPIILSPKSSMTILVLREMHREHKHVGPSLLLAISRQQYWIPNAKSIIRKIVHQCVPCTRQRATCETQLMGNLPRYRIQSGRPFAKVGIDFAGPILIHMTKGRGQRTYKSYICLFICLTIKAIHIELVSDLSSDAFLAALRRFIARRGCCEEIFSDNGTNFVGANNQLNQTFEHCIKTSNDIAHFISRNTITWHFIPPHAPNFGGIWEAAIKSTKFHLKRVIGESILTMEEMITLLAEIESILNSRPLCVLSAEDMDALTPSHFLIGQPATKLPEVDITHQKLSYLSRWQMIQHINQHFWKRWQLEYITSLQQRSKWTQYHPPLKLNDIVIIKEQNLPVNKWLFGKIVNLHPGSDGITRVVTLKTKSGELKRPINKLVKLPIEPDGSRLPECS